MHLVLSSLVNLLSAAAALIVVLLAGMISTDVALRYFFNAPINGVTELTELGVMLLVFAQLSRAVKDGRLTRSEAILGRIDSRRPRVAAVIRMLAELLGCAIFVVIAWKAGAKFDQAWTRNLYAGTRGVFTVPEWPFVAAVFLCSCTIAVQFATNALQILRSVFSGKAES